MACIAVVAGVAITRQVYSGKANELGLAKEASEYRTRAEEGDVKAQSKLGYMYSHGQGVPKDYAEALRWYRRAAAQGMRVASGENTTF